MSSRSQFGLFELVVLALAISLVVIRVAAVVVEVTKRVPPSVGLAIIASAGTVAFSALVVGFVP